MRCRDVERLVSAYVDGELDERRSSAVRGHLRLCAGCAARVEDEAALRAAAGRLEPLEPPPELWGAIDARLAEAEIADSRRSPAWLWAQRTLDLLRSRALPIGVAAAAATALLIVWVTRAPQESAAPVAGARAARGVEPGDRTGGASGSASGSARRAPDAVDSDSCARAATHEDATRCQVQAADARYVRAIAELSAALAQEREAWSAAEAARFDAALAELDHALGRELARLAAAGPPGPQDRDPLYALYRRKIELLSLAAVGGEL